jgi:hypothetical protein
MGRLVLLLAVSAVAIGVVGCGGSSGGTTDSGVSLPSGSADSGLGPAYRNYYKELLTSGVTPSTARCYQEQLEELPAEEIRELLAPGEISNDAKDRLREVNLEFEQACEASGTPFVENPTPAQEEAAKDLLSRGIRNNLESQGTPDSVITCLEERLKAQPYSSILSVEKREPEGIETFGKIGEECGFEE